MDRNTARRCITLTVVGVTAVVVLAFSLSVHFTPASAGAIFAAPLCGDGSAPDYGFTYDLQQAHWTVDWQNYASEQAVTEVDAVLDRLNEDSIAQTMILIQSQDPGRQPGQLRRAFPALHEAWPCRPASARITALSF